MQISAATYLRLRRQILATLHGTYPQRRDIHEPTVRDFATGRDPFAASGRVHALTDTGRTCCALAVSHPGYPHLQLSFFEATGECTTDAVRQLLDDARELAAGWGLDDILVGMNGHVTYGIGLLTDHHDAPVPLDVVHTPAWYTELWAGLAPLRSEGLHSYRWSTPQLRSFFTADRVARFTRGLRIRCSDLRNWPAEIDRMTALMNASAEAMPYYFAKSGADNHFLMRDMPWILRPENLLFAVDALGRDVGYVLWYDDWLDLLPPGHANPVELVLRTKLAAMTRRKPSRFVFNAMAVAPEEKGTGTIFAMLHRAAACTRSPVGESTFVADGNRLSQAVASCTGGQVFKHYRVHWFGAS